MKNILKVLLIAIFFVGVFIFIKTTYLPKTEKPEFMPVETIKKSSLPNTSKIEQIDETTKEPKPKEDYRIAQVVEWGGPDPYPSVDWSGALPELRTTVNDFEKAWGQELKIRQVYRPAEYGRHLRSVWEIWRYVNGKSYKEGYRCDEVAHIDTSKIGTLNSAQLEYLNKEASKHSFLGGDTPPGCVSDHAKGIAVDITPPMDPAEYERFIKVANSVGLCHYIAGDEPHFALTAYLPEGTDCFVK